MLRHFAVIEKFRVKALLPSNAMLEDDKKAADEFTTMSSAIKSTLKWGGRGSLAVHGNNLVSSRGFSIHKAYVSLRLLSKIVDLSFDNDMRNSTQNFSTILTNMGANLTQQLMHL